MNTQIQEPTPSTDTDARSEASEADEKLEAALHGMIRIGALWARHGLEIGRGALQNSAATMQATASLLEALASSLEAKREPQADDAA